ncbi:hypothetical protein QWY28_18360 [Nocardioides sp. SOB77]|uniref:Uncharacterized protein n=1 Tax=Nocardioides oceani TaxID=3058369 RepID=A0ABT8FKM7_9ACTN|nr:hypothetical protein [Nocardioides oceani]MDN4174932.1 hypothetical protein [Nocardioides oceani]
MLARADRHGLRLSTTSGERAFLAGVDVGATGDRDAEHLARWFGQMRGLGVRVVRTLDLQPPAFYTALVAHNQAQPDDPLYLVQGVRPPEPPLAAPGAVLTDPAVGRSFDQALRRAVDAVHGAAPGGWEADASRWLAAWTIGTEWDPALLSRTDAAGSGRTAGATPTGTYVTATEDASPSERWLAARLDAVAAAEAARGRSVPVSFVSWPTTDPLAHEAASPGPEADTVGLDPRHLRATDRWPGGTFATVHAPPYYPDFLRDDPALAEVTWRGEPDPYAGYLTALREHLGDVPLVVGALGVPASLGSAHRGPRDRHQGPHSERDALRIDAELIRLVHDQGASGAFLAAWADEWERGTWNTAATVDPAGRGRWHDPLTVDQWSGLLAVESGFVPGSLATARAAQGAVRGLLVRASPSYLHVMVLGRDRVPQRLDLLVDSVPGGGGEGADHLVQVDTAAGTARAFARAGLDPLRLYAGRDLAAVTETTYWRLYRQLTSASRTVGGGEVLPPETSAVGDLVEGSWAVDRGGYDSLSTWQVDEQNRALRLRLPWPLVGIADPSRRVAAGPGTSATLVPAPHLDLRADVDGSRLDLRYRWPAWTAPEREERLKDGSGLVAAAFAAVSP